MRTNKAKRREGRLIGASRLTMKDIFQCFFFVFFCCFFSSTALIVKNISPILKREATVKRPSRRLALFNLRLLSCSAKRDATKNNKKQTNNSKAVKDQQI